MEMTIKDIILILESADRQGSEKDEPEGTRYVQVSDTLLQKIIDVLKMKIKP
jgi:hypothetical protein